MSNGKKWIQSSVFRVAATAQGTRAGHFVPGSARYSNLSFQNSTMAEDFIKWKQWTWLPSVILKRPSFSATSETLSTSGLVVQARPGWISLWKMARLNSNWTISWVIQRRVISLPSFPQLFLSYPLEDGKARRDRLETTSVLPGIRQHKELPPAPLHHP